MKDEENTPAEPGSIRVDHLPWLIRFWEDRKEKSGAEVTGKSIFKTKRWSSNEKK